MKLFDLVRFSEGILIGNIDINDIDIVPILNAEIFAMEAMCYEKGINLKYDEYDKIMCKGNEKLLSKTFEVLMENAIKYTPEGGIINVVINDKNKKNIEIYFRNTGRGISKEDLAHIFDRFYKNDKNYKENKSFGLGLAIAKELLTYMGEDITVQSVYGEGTTFTFTLKRVGAQAAWY